MMKRLVLSIGMILGFCLCSAGDVLIVADEFPAMEVLAKRLKAEEGRASRIVAQGQMPPSLTAFEAVVVYIHRQLGETAERALIEYAEGGGRLVVLHHTISSGKRQNRAWFPFLGVELPTGDVESGGYKWTEDVTVQWVNVAGDHYVMSHGVAYPEETAYCRSGETASQVLPAFTLHETEVYLNHRLKGPRTLLMGLKYTDKQTGKTWMQDTAGWFRKTGAGSVVYFMPGHTLHDFENVTYGRIVLNAVVADPAIFK